MRIDPLITSALTAFATTVATNSSKAPMESLDNLWYVTIGHKIEALANVKRAKNEVHTAHYKDLIARKIHEISEENLQEPAMSIVGPALEASKYYIEEEELREMFANVIAASMDSTQSENVHHSFVEIIKQLSPRDARNLKFIAGNPVHPIARYSIKDLGSEGSRLIYPLVFTTDLNTGEFAEQDTPSIYNLERLGVISFSFEEHLTRVGAYLVYENSAFYKDFKSYSETKGKTPEFTKGILRLNPLGKMFTQVCL